MERLMPIQHGCSEAYQEKVHQAWKRFIEGKPVPPNVVPDHVLKGWEISRKNGVDAVNPQVPPILDKREIALLRAQYQDLLEATDPILNMLAISIRDTEYIATFSVASGHVLAVVGDDNLLNHSKRQHNVIGANRSISVMGTTALTLSIIERRPIQIIGHEHYNRFEHDWKCFAAPVFNENDAPIASLTISSHISSKDIHTIMLAKSCADCISIRIREKALMRNQKRLNALLQLVHNSLPEAVLAIQSDGLISHANNKAVEHILGGEVPFDGLSIDKIFGRADLPRILTLLRKGISETARLSVATPKGKKSCFCHFEPILVDNRKPSGATLSISLENKVISIANQVGGNYATFTFESIKGKSPALRKQIDLAKRAAQVNSRVLLVGESGTGKELFAQAIHNAGPLQTGPFVAVSCAAIPRGLIESELFGYADGAFTGARKGGMVGKIELANGGTLFLDEINSLPLDMQGKLLRALQQMEVVRIGADRPTSVNVRIIAATNRKLIEDVRRGAFREDLYFRLNVVEVTIPPLRERMEDISLLAVLFFKRQAAKMNRPAPKVFPAVLEAMQRYPWPGNVRELENVCERALLMGQDEEEITLEHLPLEISSQEAAQTAPAEEFERKVDTVYRELIRTTLSDCSGNLSRAADKLGIARSTLYRRMRNLGVEK